LKEFIRMALWHIMRSDCESAQNQSLQIIVKKIKDLLTRVNKSHTFAEIFFEEEK